MSAHPTYVGRSQSIGRSWPYALPLYPLNTRPLTDLKVILWALPILWLGGFEQIVPPVLIIWAALKLMLTRPQLRIPSAAALFALYLLWQFVPQMTLEQGRDWIVAVRNAIAYLSVLGILLIVANDVNNLEDLYSLIRSMVAVSVAATGLALLFAVQIIPGEFQALLVGNVLPGFLKGSRFVQEDIIIREIGRLDAVFGPFVYPRISSLFLSSNNAAIAYVCLLFWQWRLIEASAGVKRWLIALLFALSFLVFLFTTSRIAWLAFVISFGLMHLLRYQLRFRLPWIALPTLLSIIIGAIGLVVLVNPAITQFINTSFLEVREASFWGRFVLYQATLSLWIERPLVGWGVSVPISSVTLAPVGTHSELLGVLFRTGLIGFILYLLVMVFIWLQIGLRIRQATRMNNLRAMRISTLIAAVYFAINLMYFTYSFYWDFSVVLLTWTTIGLIYSKPLKPNVAVLGNQPTPAEVK